MFRLGEEMTLEKTLPITEGFFAYSSLAPMQDGRLALLYEAVPAGITCTTVTE